ncbi:OLC1v1029237C1 [Oldenlandia corymbosa var. corymbosa]|uniref:OLC1v1029237C1 n=1 Tax=Oldenlandia corymbosa var. corymbosa TaxID=529605 RepID=A0AAV1CDI6_OLDCO|nr:OLC1v1029237C1 [Oldenlandia corymbosa var. corymbosa]
MNIIPRMQRRLNVSSVPHYFPSSSPNTNTPHLQLAQSDDNRCFSDVSGSQDSSYTAPKTIRYRLSQLCREGEIQTARQLFDSIPQPTTVLWNSIIIGYICNNLHREALALYVKMKSFHHKSVPDPYTYSSVLKACAETNELKLGKAVHCHILRSGIHPGIIVYNSLLNMYASCLCWFDALPKIDLVKIMFMTMPERNVVAWNIMISWCLKTQTPTEALFHFVMMLKMGVRPTGISFVNIFPVATAMWSVKIADALYGSVIKMGAEFVNDLFIVSSAIHMYADLGCVVAAQRIFDNCLERNIEVWNSMVCGYVQNCHTIEAIHLFLRALDAQDAVSLDTVTFVSVLTAASQLQHLNFAQQLYAYLIKSSWVSHTIILNAIVSMYSKCNCITESFKVFSAMPERDLVSWNTMVSALVQNQMVGESLMFLQEMQNQGHIADGVTITAILSAASNLRDCALGKQAHAYIVRHHIEFEGMETDLINMYADSSLIKAAETIFNMRTLNDRDQAMWNAMISGYTHNGLVEETFAAFEQMLQQNVTLTAVTLASVLPACSQSGCLSVGKAIHGFVVRRFLDANVFLCSALVDMYSKSGSLSNAEMVFRKSPEKNSVTYTNMIFGYGQHGMGENAIMLFNSWKECGYRPDKVTLLAALSACSHSGLVTEGLQIFESMRRDYGLEPSLEHYACVVDMLGRVGRVEQAYMLVKRLGDKFDVVGIWGSILAACAVHGNFELGKVVADELLGLAGGVGRTGYQVLLSNIYAAEENWEHVDRVRRRMRRKGLTKEVGCSWIHIFGVTQCFTSKDREFTKGNDVYEILEQLTSNMKDAGYRPSFGLLEAFVLERE